MLNTIIHGDALSELKKLPDQVANCCVTSPPYWGLRDYNVQGQMGLEKSPEEFISKMVEVFREVRRVLKDDGTAWINIGDSYWGGKGQSGASWDKEHGTGKNVKAKSYTNPGETRPQDGKHHEIKPKDLVGIPWMLAFALRADGWYLRQDIIWSKPNTMPESVTDRCTKSHEYIFLLSKSRKYYYDAYAIATPYGTLIGTGKANKRSVWTVLPMAFKEAHFATYPPNLIVDCIKAGCPEGGTVLDPFMGAATTALVSRKLNLNYIGIELNKEYIEKIAKPRLARELGLFL